MSANRSFTHYHSCDKEEREERQQMCIQEINKQFDQNMRQYVEIDYLNYGIPKQVMLSLIAKGRCIDRKYKYITTPTDHDTFLLSVIQNAP
jgi:hypothetical protein